MKNKVDKKEKKENVKKILLKVWFIVSTILSILFLITLILSFEPKQSEDQQKESINNKQLNIKRLSGDNYLSDVGLYSVNDSELLTYVEQLSSSVSVANVDLDFKIAEGDIEYNRFSFIRLNSSQWQLNYTQSVSGGRQIQVATINTSSLLVSWRQPQYQYIYITALSEEAYYYLSFDSLDNVKTITLDNNFNPNFYLGEHGRNGGVIDSPYTINELNSTYGIIFDGLFYSNGLWFDRIRVPVTGAEGKYYNKNSNSIETLTIQDQYQVRALGLQYVNSVNSVSQSVMSYGQGFTNDGSFYWIPNDFYFLSDLFKTIKVYKSEVVTTALGTNDSVDNLLISFNVANVGIIIGNSSNGSDVFDFLAGAFGSMLPILSVSIIPGLTIGALVVLPLIVIVVITIIRLVKK